MWAALLVTVVLGAVLYKLLKSNSNSFWKKHGIPYIDTSPGVGKVGMLLGKMAEADEYAYKQMGNTHKFCGIMELFIPVVLVKDMEIIKNVLIKDALEHFVDRRQFISDEDGCLKKILFSLDGDEWKGVRSSVSPTFTTGKIRRMMDSFNSVADEWVQEYTRQAKASPSGSINIDVLKSINQYTVEVISTCAFGMNAGVIKDPNSIFMQMVNRTSSFTKAQVAKLAIRLNFPKLSKLLKLGIFDMEAIEFFNRILSQNLQSRMRGETKRNDFLQLMVEAKKGELKAAGADELSSFEKDAQLSPGTVPKQQYFTEDMMNSQSMQFFFAGFSTTSNFITFALYTLAVHQDAQEKLRQEVKKIVKEDGSLDYDDVGHLVYMDMVTQEVLRKFSAVTRLERLCVKDYKDPENGLSIPKGTVVGVPVNAIHNDKQYYANPDKFDPEHFSPANKAARTPYAFMPFGMGVRNCIGMRFALIEVKSAVAHILHNFIVEPTARTPLPLQGELAGFQIVPPKNLELKLTPLKNK